tara:strand:+ start:340 stop:666 length:327 start_codon:yes stop_codon:yes gene_type:complete
MLTNTPNPPYYPVIFTSILVHHDPEYFGINDLLRKQAEKMEGFLGEDSARNEYGISISYWRDLESIEVWRQNSEHRWAKEKEKKDFYKAYNIRIARVENEYNFIKPPQ